MKMIVRLVTGALCCSVALISTTGVPAATTYHFEWLAPAATSSRAWDVNASGVAVGQCNMPLPRACLMDGTVVVDVHPPIAAWADSEAFALNDAGHVVLADALGGGWFWDGVNHVRMPGVGTDINNGDYVVGFMGVRGADAFGWSPSRGHVDLSGVIGRDVVARLAVNDSGHVAGLATDVARRDFEFFYHDGSTTRFTRVGLPSVLPSSWPGRIDDVGQFVGAAASTGSLHGFVYDVRADSARDLHPTSGTLAGFAASTAHEINRAGQIVGGARPSSFSQGRAMLVEGDLTIDLQEFMPASVVTSEATAINDSGVIVGEAQDGAFLRAFRLTPVNTFASVGVTPHAVNAGVLLGRLTARFEVAPDRDRRIVADSLELRSVGGEGVPGGNLRPVSLVETGRGIVQATFDRHDLARAIDGVRGSLGADLELLFAGRFDDGTTFLASDNVRVLGLGVSSQAGHARRARN